jgi:3-hydroxyanthranilate 3,4-dioxygenase
MILKINKDGVFRDVVINEGDMFLLQKNIPHNPVRFADTVGIVIERTRPLGENGTRDNTNRRLRYAALVL